MKRSKLVCFTTVLLALLIGSAGLDVTHVKATELKMVVTAAFVSEKGVHVYNDIASYIGKKTGWNTNVVSGLSYSEADEMLESGLIQVGFICGLPYTKKADAGSVELAGIPVMNLKAGTYPDAPGYEKVPGKYYSYTIVKKGSQIASWKDLKGKTYAYNDPGSNSGYNLPRSKLISMGTDWSYFKKVVQSGSHEESIRMVASGLVDASSVDSLVLDYDRSIGDKSAMGVKIIESIGPAGAPPVVISRKVDPAIRATFVDVLTGMHKDPEGRKILDKALVLRFDPPAPANYNDIRELDHLAAQVRFNDIE